MVDKDTRRALLVIGGDQSAEYRLHRVLRADYDVRWVADRAAALSAIDERPPALIVIMTAVDAGDALELCSDLRTGVMTRRSVIVVHSQANTVDARVAASQAGADEFVTRPYTSAALRARLRSLLELKERSGSDTAMRRTSRPR